MARRIRQNSVQDLADEAYDPIWFRAEFVVAAIALVCFINALPNNFCDDGVPIVQENPLVNEPGHWLTIWTTDHWHESADANPNRDLLYRPIALTSYRLVRFLAGPDPLPQLAANVLLHMILSVLVVRLCRHLKGDYASALLAGMIFAVLPIHTEVIDNVVGRADLLAALGVTLAVLWHRRSMIATTDWGIIKWRIGAGLGIFLAMGAKESGATVAVVIILADRFWYQKWRAASKDRNWGSLQSLLRFAYLVPPMALYFALRAYALKGNLFQAPALTKTVNALVDAPFWQHILGTLQLWGMYWAKTFWPRILCVNYTVPEIRLATSVFDPSVLLGIAVLLGLTIASIIAWRRGVKGIALATVIIVVTYLPTSNAFVLIQVFFAERIWYLPSVWVAVLSGLALGPRVRKPMWFALASVVVFAMTARCWIRNAEWRNNRTLYAATWFAHKDAIGAILLHGQELVRNGEVDEGIELLHHAVTIDQGYTDAQRSLGQAYLQGGNFGAALHHLQLANIQIPGHAATEEALAFVKETLRTSHSQALDAARQLADNNPQEVGAEIAFLKKLQKYDRFDEALARLKAREADFSADLAWQVEYAVTLVLSDNRDDAVVRYQKCIELAPENPILRVELAMLLFERRDDGDIDQAWDLCNRAAAIDPIQPEAILCQAELYAFKGDISRALELYRSAIDLLSPADPRRSSWQQRARTLGSESSE